VDYLASLYNQIAATSLTLPLNESRSDPCMDGELRSSRMRSTFTSQVSPC
jgi:hypothetical protein